MMASYRGAFSASGGGPSDSVSTGSGDPLRDAATSARDGAFVARDGASAYATNLRSLAPGAPSPSSRLAADTGSQGVETGSGVSSLPAAAVLEEFERAARFVARHGEAELAPEQLEALQVYTAIQLLFALDNSLKAICQVSPSMHPVGYEPFSSYRVPRQCQAAFHGEKRL